MPSMYSLLIAGAVALFIFGIVQVAMHALNSERRRLKARLAGEVVGGGAARAPLSITLQEQDKHAISAILGRFKLFESIEKQLLQSFPETSLGKFLGVSAAIGIGVVLVAFLLSGSFIIGIIAGICGAYVPFLVLTNKRNRRQKALADQLPDALDFLSRILRAGHSLATGLQMMGEELPQPLAGEFQRAYDQTSLGIGIDEALKDITKRIDSTDFAFFVTAVLIQRQTGGDLSEVLGNISGMIRKRVRLQQHVKAKTAEGRFTGYILSAFPLLMFLVAYTLNPSYAGVLINTSTGLMLLGVAFGLQLLGLWAIKKITTINV